ncbi:MAG: dihydrodipicolinate synthase family protein [Oscillospiraceae bacterium]
MVTNTTQKLHGIVPAIVTPMNENGDINFSLLEKQAQYLKDVGVHGIFACGGTGEGAYLSIEEKKDVYNCVRSVVGKDLFICLAVINSNTRAVLKDMDYLSGCDADYIVSTTPYYHGADQSVIKDHYRQVAAHSSAPVIVYNIPSATSNPIDIDTVTELSQLDNIAGVKDSSGDFCQFSRGLFGQRSADFSWIQGEDYLCAPSFLCGANGAVSGLSNAKAEPYVEMYNAFLANDAQKIMACQAKINVLYKIIHGSGYKNGNAAIKTVCELEGRGSHWMRQSSLSFGKEQIARVAKILEEYNAL